MKLTLTIHDERTKPETYSYSTPKTEEYVRTEVALEGRSRLVADTLRAIANEIDPPQNASRPDFSGVALR
jgi:hypothetical protein